MARRKGIRKSQDNNVPGAPGATPFRPMNGAGPGQRDPRSAGQDNAGFFMGGPGGQHNPGRGQARPQDMNGGRKPRPQRGEPGMSYAGGTPGFYDEGGPGAPGKVYENGELPKVGGPGGAQIQPFPGGRNGGDNLPGFGGQFPGGGDNSIGIPRGEVGTPFDGNMPPQSPGGRPAPSKGRGRGGRPQRPPGRGMPSGGPGLSRPQFPGMNVPGAPGTKMPNAPGMNINQTFNGDQNTVNR